MNKDKYVIGVDYGTLSGRALLVRISDGAEIASAVLPYKHAVIEDVLPASGEKLPVNWALQVPQDYVDVLLVTIPEVLKNSGINPADVIGMGTDFTACTMIPTRFDGTPLCEIEEFSRNPHAYVKLWKHHAAQPYADRINELAHARKEPWIVRYGGKVSSEWAFAKGLELLEEAPEVYSATECWVEAADWIIWQLTGQYVKNACTAGYKELLQDGDYPIGDFLKALNPDFENFASDKVAHQLGELGDSAGKLTAEMAEKLGLPAGISVAVGNVDAHVTAAAAQATGNGQMVAIMGTSTCHVINGANLKTVPGMCGAVFGGITPGAWGYEAGQSGVGDLFAWVVDNLVPTEYLTKASEKGLNLHEYLSELASEKAIGEHGLIALDWLNGNRSTLVDHHLSGNILGVTLATKPEDLYAAIVESTAFGARMIVETFEKNGVAVDDFIAAGGLIKNKYLMQIYADVLGRPIHIIGSDQGPALGSAIHAAVAAGAYKDIHEASKVMGTLKRDAFTPNREHHQKYSELYSIYEELYRYFGDGRLMHKLRTFKAEGRLVNA